jgi:type IV pilus assembly protein PilE
MSRTLQALPADAGAAPSAGGLFRPAGGSALATRRDRLRAFSLMEVLIVISVLALLTTLAYPTYQGQVLRMRRTDAKQSLLRTAQQLERCYTRYRRYNYWVDSAHRCPQVHTENNTRTVSVPSGDGYYVVSSRASGGGETLTAETFSLFATPNTQPPKDGQSGDTLCARFQVDNNLTRGALSSSNSDTTDQCW